MTETSPGSDSDAADRLTAIMDEIVAFRDERDWRQFHAPKELASAIAIEAGELQELFLWRGIEPAEQVHRDGERLAKIRDEAADVAILLFLFCRDLDIDLVEAIRAKLAKNARRYPVEEWRGRRGKAPPLAEDA